MASFGNHSVVGSPVMLFIFINYNQFLLRKINLQMIQKYEQSAHKGQISSEINTNARHICD